MGVPHVSDSCMQHCLMIRYVVAGALMVTNTRCVDHELQLYMYWFAEGPLVDVFGFFVYTSGGGEYAR